MKSKKILVSMVATAAILFTACSGKEELTVNSVTLDRTAASVEVGKTITLTATVNPTGAATVTWESANPDIATVSNGVVTGIKEGNTIIVATADSKTATCIITVAKEGAVIPEPPLPGDLHPSLQGSEYYIIQMDGTTSAKIQSKIVADFRPNDNTKNLYIWPDGSTYDAGSTSGRNFYGEVEDWISLTVANVGWSGFGMSVGDPVASELNALSAIMADPSAYYFHIAMKSTDNASHLLGLDGALNTNGRVCIGATPFVDGATFVPFTDITRDGEWNEIEIPMTYFTNQGLTYIPNNTTGLNVLMALSGGVAGVTLQFDACFIYKK